jgi:hypothetical protein
MRHLAAVAACTLLAVQAMDAPVAKARSSPAPGRRVLIAFLPTEPAARMPLLFRLERRGFAVGLVSPTLGGYAKRQLALDVGQGARVSTRVYSHPLERLDLVEQGNGGRISRWRTAVKRADDAPGDVVPGLLAETVRRAGGGVGYAGVVGFEQLEAVAAADRAGRIGAVSLGTMGTSAMRIDALLARDRLVVARLPDDRAGLRQLDRLIGARRPGDTIIVVRAPPGGGLKLLPAGILGPGFRGGLLRSATTRRDGLVTATDLAPTALRQLGLSVPDDMQGRRIEPVPGAQAERALELSARLNVVTSRRVPTLRFALALWLALLVVLRGLGGQAGTRAALRIGFLGALWLPGVALLTAALEPSRGVEVLLIPALSLALGVATDRLFPWPLAPAVPAAAVFAAHMVDLALGSSLIIRSVAGPNPKVGARFFGIGNELEAILATMVLLGAGAGLTRAPPRLLPRAFAAVSLVAAVVIGAGRLGADVGGVITLAAGGADAVLASLPGGPSRRAVALAVLAPVAGVLALIGLDVVTGSGAHLTGSVVHAKSPGDLLDVAFRRFRISFGGLKTGTTPISVGIAIALLVYGTVKRETVLAPLDDVPGGRAFRAGLAGAVGATSIGALANDSGPVIVLIGTLGLLLATAYVRGRPGPRAEAVGAIRGAGGGRPHGALRRAADRLTFG